MIPSTLLIVALFVAAFVRRDLRRSVGTPSRWL